MSADPSYISFPKGVVADEPVRIPILWNSDEAIALNKPPGMAAFQDSRVGGGPRSILAAINNRMRKEGSQFERLGIDTLFPINLLDREASGLLLCAKDEAAKSRLKNAMGSSQVLFRYRFLTAASCEEETVSCSLPVAIHRQKPLALVSHQTGKKTVTEFRRMQHWGAASLWEAESVYDRFHQIRLHAAEAGLPILGDTLYQPSRRARVTDVPPQAAGNLAPDRLCLHLASIRLPMGETWLDLEAPFPDFLGALVKKLTR